MKVSFITSNKFLIGNTLLVTKLVSNLDYFFHDMIEIQKVDTDTEGPALVNRLPFSRSAIREEHKAERRMRNAEMEAVMITVESLVELNIMEPLQEHKPLSYWKLYQNKTGNFKVKAAFLSVVKKLLTPPATSTNVERLFSIAGLISDKRRKKLLPQRLEKILFLRENLYMLSFKLEW